MFKLPPSNMVSSHPNTGMLHLHPSCDNAALLSGPISLPLKSLEKTKVDGSRLSSVLHDMMRVLLSTRSDFFLLQGCVFDGAEKRQDSRPSDRQLLEPRERCFVGRGKYCGSLTESSINDEDFLSRKMSQS